MKKTCRPVLRYRVKAARAIKTGSRGQGRMSGAMSRELECPKCAGMMEQVVLGGVSVERCRLCRGIWFDADEFAKLRELEGSESVDDGSPFIGNLKDGVRNVVCPVCKLPMVSFEPPGTRRKFTLERCPSCKGMFFDAGEYSDFVLDESFWEEVR